MHAPISSIAATRVTNMVFIYKIGLNKRLSVQLGQFNRVTLHKNIFCQEKLHLSHYERLHLINMVLSPLCSQSFHHFHIQ